MVEAMVGGVRAVEGEATGTGGTGVTGAGVWVVTCGRAEVCASCSSLLAPVGSAVAGGFLPQAGSTISWSLAVSVALPLATSPDALEASM